MAPVSVNGIQAVFVILSPDVWGNLPCWLRNRSSVQYTVSGTNPQASVAAVFDSASAGRAPDISLRNVTVSEQENGQAKESCWLEAYRSEWEIRPRWTCKRELKRDGVREEERGIWEWGEGIPCPFSHLLLSLHKPVFKTCMNTILFIFCLRTVSAINEYVLRTAPFLSSCLLHTPLQSGCMCVCL